MVSLKPEALKGSVILTHGHTGQLPGGPMIIGAPHMLCTVCFYCLNTDFVGSTNTINVCLILSTFSFIPVSGCVGMGPSELLCPGAFDAVKMALDTGSYLFTFKLVLIYIYILLFYFLFCLSHY